MQRAEYLKEGTKLIFREGRTKGLGTVREVFPVKEPPVVGSSAPTTADGTSKSHVRSPTKDAGSVTATATGKTSTRGRNRQQTGDTGKSSK
jgi:hypothetical protein